jgi:hypothetical protein
VLTLAACGGRGGPATPAPASAPDALAGFLDAVRDNDRDRIARLWGSQRGPAVGWMDGTELGKRVALIQGYLTHSEYRLVEGPATVPGADHLLRFRVELRRGECLHVQSIDVVRVRRGGWVVYDPHIESLPGPLARCGSGGSGTPR